MSNWAFALFGTAAVVLLTVVIAIGARRLLGLRAGALRMIVAALVGFGAAQAFAGTIEAPLDRGVLATVMVGISVLVTMGFLVLAEIVMRERSRPVEWTRRIRRRLVRARRYAQIGKILMRHGLSPYFPGRNRRLASAYLGRGRLAYSLRRALEDGGVTFVKLGQLLSTRPDVLPKEFIDELSKLQCQVPAAPWPSVRQVLSEDLGALADEVFAEFDPEPLAAGSVAQVHRARLRDGTDVVVKVQRPDIRRVVECDLDILHRLAATLEARAEWARAIGAAPLAEGFAAALAEELDFRVEARNMNAIAAGIESGGDGPRVPVLTEWLCTERVLVMERLAGVPLGSAQALIEERGLDRRELATTLLGCVLRQVMTHGVFHCDPHPGNVFLLDDNRLALLDFGIVGRLDGRVRSALQSLLIAIERDDRAALCDALLDIVVRRENIDEVELERALGEFMARHLTAGVSADMEMFNQLFQLIARYGLAVPPQVAAVFRTLTTLQGTLAQLAPGFDVVSGSKEFVSSYCTERFRPSSVRDAVRDDLIELLPMLRRLPRRIERISTALEQGRLSMTVRLVAHERDRRHVTALVHQGLLTVLGAAAGIMAVLLLGTSGGPQITPSLSLLHVFGYNLLVVSSVLGMRVLVNVLRGGT